MATAAETVVRPRRRRSGLSERRLAALMISPAVLVILLVAAYPIATAIWLSLHQYSLITKGLSRWSGFDNYSTALWGDQHQAFWSAFKTTFIFTGIYTSDTNPDVRKTVINALFIQNNAAALVTLARAEKNVELKKDIVSKLSNMKSKEATDYLMELLK